ncbi:hypothetical protein ABK040_014037 [Willaertia magna]
MSNGSSLTNLITPLITQIDKHQNKLLIPKQTHNFNFSSNNDFEIYLSGVSTKCGLMIGKGSITQNEEEEDKPILKDYFKESPWPYFLKFTRENIPITLQKEEYIKLVSCGLQHLIIVTNFSKCYLFGDISYEINDHRHFAQLLPFQMNDNTLQNQLNCKITNLDCGEQYVILKDELNRFWYYGRNSFGCGPNPVQFHFTQLNRGELKETDNIKKLVAGGRHAAVNVNDKFIYCIGNNYYYQLGTHRNGSNVFVKADWNLDEKYTIKMLECSGNSTIVLTTCGKLFKTYQSKYLTLVNSNERILTIGTDWSNMFFLTAKGSIWRVGDRVDDLKEVDSIKINLFTKNNNYKDIKLFTGTSSSCFGMFNEKEAFISRNGSKTERLITNLPIINIKISGEIVLVFCSKEEKLSNIQSKLFNINGLFDIKLVF